MVSVAAIGGASIAEVPGVGGGGTYVDQGAVGQKLGGTVLASCATEEIGRWGCFYMYGVLYAVAAAVQVMDDQVDKEIARGGVQMAWVLIVAGVQGPRGGVAEIPVPGGYLAAKVLVGIIIEYGILVLAVAPEGETGYGASCNTDYCLKNINTTFIIGYFKTHFVVSFKLKSVGNIWEIGIINCITRRSITKVPNPLLYVSLPRWV